MTVVMNATDKNIASVPIIDNTTYSIFNLCYFQVA